MCFVLALLCFYCYFGGNFGIQSTVMISKTVLKFPNNFPVPGDFDNLLKSPGTKKIPGIFLEESF